MNCWRRTYIPCGADAFFPRLVCHGHLCGPTLEIIREILLKSLDQTKRQYLQISGFLYFCSKKVHLLTKGLSSNLKRILYMHYTTLPITLSTVRLQVSGRIMVKSSMLIFLFIILTPSTGSAMGERSPPEREVASSSHNRVIPKTGKMVINILSLVSNYYGW